MSLILGCVYIYTQRDKHIFNLPQLLWFQYSRSYFWSLLHCFPSSCGFSMAYKKWYGPRHKANLRTSSWCICLELMTFVFWNIQSTSMSRVCEQKQCKSRHGLHSSLSLRLSWHGFLYTLFHRLSLCNASLFKRVGKSTLSRTSSQIRKEWT